ncbi:nucleotide sugar dehydrogenase [Ruminococcaceae bacterium OttesenSCG-928-A16]|nr:nucleotide sugar dehydrogenase [Ruminococcaceae bacterium OttesenSCG-928-A16]
MHTRKIAVIGLGYVGLPVAVAFGLQQKTIGFDINEKRLAQLQNGEDETGEANLEQLRKSNIEFTNDIDVLKQADFYIIAVPTPVNDANIPDLSPILGASQTVGKALKKGDIVVYESTVYPGCTEDDCVPVLEKVSGLTYGKDFAVGYSPERINPGDKVHTFTTIRKIVSGSNLQTSQIVADVYSSVITAGVYSASCIKVAEAAKIIENTQRDINIALMNELSIIFDRIGVDTKEVLEAAGTKWNFLNFTPGLVGGHCIGVDPYYLTYQSQRLGYNPQVILAGRRINDSMGAWIAEQTVKTMIKAGGNLHGALVSVLGLTFKENCPDLRNSKVIDIVTELESFGINVQVADALAEADSAKNIYGISLVPFNQLKKADAIIVAVAHDDYAKLSPEDFRKLSKTEMPVIIDVKSALAKQELLDARCVLWRL